MNQNFVKSLFGQSLRQTVELSGRPVVVQRTWRAVRALAKRDSLLVVEMELAFACLARKTVRFHEQLPEHEYARVTEKLAVYAHSILPDCCEAQSAADAPASPKRLHLDLRPFTPKWLWIDFRHGQWIGEFGIDSPRS